MTQMPSQGEAMNFESIFVKLGGVIPAVGESCVPMTESEIADFERKHELVLPGLYREFLQRYGMSAFDNYIDINSVTPLPPEVFPSGKGHFGLFFGGWTSEDEEYSLEWNSNCYCGRVPHSLLPIGGDGMGSLICLGTSGNELGKVYYWDHENEPLDDDTYEEDFGQTIPTEVKFQNVYRIADSFDDFLERLEVSQNG